MLWILNHYFSLCIQIFLINDKLHLASPETSSGRYPVPEDVQMGTGTSPEEASSDEEHVSISNIPDYDIKSFAESVNTNINNCANHKNIELYSKCPNYFPNGYKENSFKANINSTTNKNHSNNSYNIYLITMK